MKWNRTTAIFATIGAAATGYMAVMAYRRLTASDFDSHAAFSAGEHGTRRSAGPEAMRDPPAKWDRVDQAVDESFPASDPAPVGSRVD